MGKISLKCCFFAGGKRLFTFPTLKSVAAIFRRDDTEDNEVEEGAKDSEETGAFGAFWGG